MTQIESRRVFKYCVATYLSTLAVFLFGFKMTTSIAFSAIFVISYGPTWRACVSYSLHRLLAQLIGVACGGMLYWMLIARANSFLPEAQRMAIAMTLGLAVVLCIKYICHLDIADFTMFTPVFLTLLMTASNDYYPLLRVIYCSIGVIVGICVNLVIPSFSRKDRQNLYQKILQERELLFGIMDNFQNGHSFLAGEENQLEELARLEKEIVILLRDTEKSVLIVNSEQEMRFKDFSREHVLHQSALRAMRAVDSTPPGTFKAQAMDMFGVLFTAHKSIVQRKENGALQLFAVPGGGLVRGEELFCLSELLCYHRDLIHSGAMVIYQEVS